MSRSNDSVSNPNPPFYQKQKLYIEELFIDEDLETFEKDLKMFLSKYGTIIDMKILQNRKLTRTTEALRICYFPRRRKRRASSINGC